ncbi:MAG: hypothetical protein SVK08_05385 [Halobacteriota archaeon]|nr:hypothetical protein [Halobacteriota archaeon]
MSKGIISFTSHALALGIIVTVVFFLLAGVSAAEAPSEEWNRTYGGGGKVMEYTPFKRLQMVGIYLQAGPILMVLVEEMPG